MAKSIRNIEPKIRASNYDEKVKFEGKFIDMVKISVNDADKKIKAKKSSN